MVMHSITLVQRVRLATLESLFVLVRRQVERITVYVRALVSTCWLRQTWSCWWLYDQQVGGLALTATGPGAAPSSIRVLAKEIPFRAYGAPRRFPHWASKLHPPNDRDARWKLHPGQHKLRW